MFTKKTSTSASTTKTERQPLQQQQQPDYFTLELGPHSGPTWGATAPVLISKDLALGADFVFEQYREGVADRAAENERRRSSKGGKRGNRDGALEGGELRHSADGGCVPAPHPVDDVLRELGLGEFAADGGGANAADFGFGKSSAEDGREEEGVRFLRLLRQAASPQAMLHGYERGRERDLEQERERRRGRRRKCSLALSTSLFLQKMKKNEKQTNFFQVPVPPAHRDGPCPPFPRGQGSFGSGALVSFYWRRRESSQVLSFSFRCAFIPPPPAHFT